MENKSILLVDDQPDNLKMLMNLLKGTYKVKVANNGEKALQIVQKSPDLNIILLDVVMPGMDGYEVCRRLKSNDSTKNIPIIFVTSNTEESEKQKGIDAGCADYMSKPINPTELYAIIEKYM